MLEEYQGTSFLKEEISKQTTEPTYRAIPLHVTSVMASSHEEAARLIKTKKEDFHGKEVVVIETWIKK